MGIIKFLSCTVIVCGVLVQFVPDKFSGLAFDCVVVCGICIYVLSAVTTVGFEFVPNFDSAYDYVEEYTQHVELQQMKLFDDIAAKENLNATQ